MLAPVFSYVIVAAGESYAPTRQRVIKEPETGVRREVTVPKRIRPWWFVAENGRVCLSVKYGSRIMELAKGKSAVEVAGPQELMPLLGRGINSSMTIEEIVREYIRETVKPLTPEKARIKSLQGGVERARQALQSERDRQRRSRELERQRKASQALSRIVTN